MAGNPPPLPVSFQKPSAKSKKTAFALGCGGLAAVAVVFLGSLLFAGGKLLDSIDKRADAARKRLGERVAEAEATQPEVIPGLKAVDVYLNLEPKGFSTKKEFGAEQSTYVCELSENDCSYAVTAYTPRGNVSDVKVVSVMAQWHGEDENATTTKLKPFMGFAATFPYRGANPTAARQWVESNLGRKAVSSFGGVKYELFARGRSRLLRLSMDPLKESEPALPAPAPVPAEPPPTEKETAPIQRPAEPAPLISDPKPPTPPRIGQTFAEVVADYGEPSIKDSSTGWAWWKDFKVKFINAKAVEISSKE